jgi:hypothetical protein
MFTTAIAYSAIDGLPSQICWNARRLMSPSSWLIPPSGR